MASFSPADAALEGFRIARERPATIGFWALLQLVASVVLYWMITASPVGAILTDIAAQTAAAPPAADPAAAQARAQEQMAQVVALGQAMGPLYVMLIPFMIVFQTVQSAALMRVVLRPQQVSPGYFRLGMDEVRLMVVILVKALLIGLGSGLVVFVFSFLGFFLGMAMGLLFAFLGFLAAIGGAIWLSVRLSLAVPQSFAEQRISIFGSWALTRGHFWTLLASYFIAFVLFLVVLLIGALATGALTLAVGMATGQPAEASFSSPAAFFTPLQIVNMVLGSVISALCVAIAGAPAAVIYRKLTGRDEAEVF